MKSLLFRFILSLIFIAGTNCLPLVATAQAVKPQWRIQNSTSIERRIPESQGSSYADRIEMSGRKVSSIVSYRIDSAGKSHISYKLIWPALRTIPGKSEPEWANYRAYLSRNYDDQPIRCNISNREFRLPSVSKITINGFLKFTYRAVKGVVVTREFFPSTKQGAFIELWKFTNKAGAPVTLTVKPLNISESDSGIYGKYLITRKVNESAKLLKPGRSMRVSLITSAVILGHSTTINASAEKTERQKFIDRISSRLILKTPEPLCNTMFALAKIRTAESIFDTKMGPVHSPGGERYYGGIWANDQAEYAGPFFPYLGYGIAVRASLNAYLKFMTGMKADYHKIWASYEMEGDLPCCSKDRGDAAMFAYGASLFAMAQGDAKIARELWPGIQWCVEYCRRHTTADGVIASQSDEMEGRLTTGTANLSTSVLTFGALRYGSLLARSIGQTDSASVYLKRADSLKIAINRYFGAEVSGYETYRYFKDYPKLRGWICLPLIMGIDERKKGTLDALFQELWSPEGIAIEQGLSDFWDRQTLYSLRAAFLSGEPDRGLFYLSTYSKKRLLGKHVPYAVETSQEGGQAQLAAESALYCRVYTEGLFGISPVGLHSFALTPQLPSAWRFARLQNIRAFGKKFDIGLTRQGQQIKVIINQAGRTPLIKSVNRGQTLFIDMALNSISTHQSSAK